MSNTVTSTSIDKIADKIQKLLSLAGNNPSMEEAQAALLKAQQLMAQYNLNETDLNTGEKIKYSLELCVCKIDPRTKRISAIIAPSFAVKAIITDNHICMFGREKNAKAAKAAMEYIFKVLERGIRQVCKNHGMSSAQKGASLIYNSYADGFIYGLKEAMAEQTLALAIIVPEDVKDKFSERFPKLRTTTARMTRGYFPEAYNKGRTDGKASMERKKINS